MREGYLFQCLKVSWLGNISTIHLIVGMFSVSLDSTRYSQFDVSVTVASSIFHCLNHFRLSKSMLHTGSRCCVIANRVRQKYCSKTFCLRCSDYIISHAFTNVASFRFTWKRLSFLELKVVCCDKLTNYTEASVIFWQEKRYRFCLKLIFCDTI